MKTTLLRRTPTNVAQTCSLPYRGFSIRFRPRTLVPSATAARLADCKSAIQQIGKSALRRARFILPFAFCLLPCLLLAASNDLTTALQKGLFEEEANHNLDAAIQAYQSVANQFDKDRKLAATAVFRLGECYRKLGRTNDAVAQYERVVSEFSDQPTLATLSRQNLMGLGAAPQSVAVPAPETETAYATQRAVEQFTSLKAQFERLISLKGAERRIAVQQDYPNPVLTTLMQQLSEAEQKLAMLKKDYDVHHPEVERGVALVETINKQIETQVDGVLTGLQTKMAAARETANSLRAQLAKAAPAGTVESAASTDEEAQEVRRIQALIQNSPDLINALDSDGLTPLLKAASKGQLAVARFLLDHGADVNRQSSGGQTPLHFAARNAQNAVVELLLSRGANVDARDKAGWTPLYDVAGRGYKAVAETLLAHKADVNAKANDGRTPLHRAADSSQLALVELLLAHGADVNAADNNAHTPLMVAAMNSRNAAVVKALLAAKADPAPQDNNGRTALSYATEKNEAESVKALLEAKADPNAGKRDLPLAMAVNLPGTNVADLLLHAGADPNREAPFDFSGGALDFYGRALGSGVKCTPLQVAVGRERADLAKLFFQFKADAKAKSPWGDLPLVLSTYWRPDLLKAFLDAGADPNADDGQGTSVLVMAAGNGNAASVEALLEAGARVNPPADARAIPLFAAIQKGDEKTIRLLLDAGAEVNRRDRDGYTPLLRAVEKRSAAIATLLLAHGADPNMARVDTGTTPLHLATAYEDRGLVQLLLTNKADVNLRNRDGQTPLDLAKTKVAQAGMPVVPMMPPPPAGVPGRPPGYQQRAEQEPQPASTVSLADMLRQHGALDNLPRLDVIQVSRASANSSTDTFWKGTNDWNQFSLLEVIARRYNFISYRGSGDFLVYSREIATLWSEYGLRFPDFRNVVIHRPSADGRSWASIPVNVADILSSGDCSRDVMLRWGDVVEIPEADHPVAEKWQGLSDTDRTALIKCVSRSVAVAINGTNVTLKLAPKYLAYPSNLPVPPDAETQEVGAGRARLTTASFMLRSVLDQSKLIRFSSDLSRVKITRRDAATGQTHDWVLDCSGGNAPDFWLRDGDVIEVPEK